ncbi:MAG: DNA polymerase III subunit gamma/tau [Butyrivibrio sp.]
MSYTALYRKWRPDNFADVKGQDHIVTTLKNQIATDRIGHAYLFCGTRGTGKTTIAKILAKAVNCLNPVDGNPCGECEVCKAIANGSSLNVIEIDAASNNGVDNIRQIREEVAYRPTEGRYKVYIIDEVHMLSIGAFNALLKTLEEPPSYVIFILATTEANKIPVTIMSRCQRYDFKRISVDTITERLKELTVAENARVEDEALHYIAKMADGAMRDALSLLDQCMSYYIGRELKYENVLEVLGTVDTEVFSRMLRYVINEDITALIKQLDEMILAGRDLTQFVSDFTWYLRNLLMIKTSPEAESMIDMSKENLNHLKEEAYMVSEDAVMRYIRILSELSSSLKFATQKRVMVEVSLIKLARPQMETDMTSVTERLKRLEELVKEKEDIIALTAIRPAVAAETPRSFDEESNGQKRPAPGRIKALSEDLRKVVENWKGIIGQSENIYANYLKAVRLTVIEDKLVMVTEDPFVKRFLSSENALNSVKNTIEQTIGKSVEIEIRLLENNTTFEDSFTDVEQYVKMNIAIEDE